MKRMNRTGTSLLYFLCCASAAFAQPSQTTPVAGQLRTQSAASTAEDRRLVLDVVVTDRSGKVVKGLTQKDFTVLDNGHQQTILSFQASGGESATTSAQSSAGPPVEIILLVDEVNTNFRRVAYERDEIKRFLMQNEGVLAHPTSMAFFSDTGAEIQQMNSRDGNAVLAAFDQHETGLRSIRRGAGFYGAVERFQLSLNALNSLVVKEAQTPGRKLVVWISPGWPILSGPEVEISAKQGASLFASIVSLSTALRQARMTLYSIDPEGTEDAGGIRTFYYKEFLKPITAAKNALPGNLALQVLATQSGGLVFVASNDITGQIDHCVADASAFYTLTLDAAVAERANEYHSIEVKVATPGLSTRTRSGYYVQP